VCSSDLNDIFAAEAQLLIQGLDNIDVASLKVTGSLESGVPDLLTCCPIRIRDCVLRPTRIDLCVSDWDIRSILIILTKDLVPLHTLRPISGEKKLLSQTLLDVFGVIVIDWLELVVDVRFQNQSFLHVKIPRLVVSKLMTHRRNGSVAATMMVSVSSSAKSAVSGTLSWKSQASFSVGSDQPHPATFSAWLRV
jgi:hypothetical protein